MGKALRQSKWISAMLEVEAVGKSVAAVEFIGRSGFRLVIGEASTSPSVDDDDWTKGAGQETLPRA